MKIFLYQSNVNPPAGPQRTPAGPQHTPAGPQQKQAQPPAMKKRTKRLQRVYEAQLLLLKQMDVSLLAAPACVEMAQRVAARLGSVVAMEQAFCALIEEYRDYARQSEIRTKLKNLEAAWDGIYGWQPAMRHTRAYMALDHALQRPVGADGDEYTDSGDSSADERETERFPGEVKAKYEVFWKDAL
jgi:hypothetical protein